jgi:hypothetical protein
VCGFSVKPMRKNKEIERRTDSKRRPGALARIPAKWNHFADKDSRQINMLEQSRRTDAAQWNHPLWRRDLTPPPTLLFARMARRDELPGLGHQRPTKNPRKS